MPRTRADVRAAGLPTCPRRPGMPLDQHSARTGAARFASAPICCHRLGALDRRKAVSGIAPLCTGLKPSSNALYAAKARIPGIAKIVNVYALFRLGGRRAVPEPTALGILMRPSAKCGLSVIGSVRVRTSPDMGQRLLTSSAASMHYGQSPLMILAFQSASRRSASSSSPARAADAQGTASVEMTNIRGLKNHAVGGILHPVRVVSSTRRFEQARLGIEV